MLPYSALSHPHPQNDRNDISFMSNLVRRINSNNSNSDGQNNVDDNANPGITVDNVVQAEEEDNMTTSYYYRRLLAIFPFLVCLLFRFLFSFLLKIIFVGVAVFSLYRLEQTFSDLQAAQLIAKQNCNRLLITGLVSTAAHLCLLTLLVPLLFHDNVNSRLVFTTLSDTEAASAESFDYCLWVCIVTDLACSGYVMLAKLLLCGVASLHSISLSSAYRSAASICTICK